MNAVIGGAGVNEAAIAHAMTVNADPTSADLADTATDAQLRVHFDAVIARSITAWAS